MSWLAVNKNGLEYIYPNKPDKVSYLMPRNTISCNGYSKSNPLKGKTLGRFLKLKYKNTKTNL